MEVSSARVQRKVAKSMRFVEKIQSTQAALATRDKGIHKKSKRKSKKGESLRQLQAESLAGALGSLSESLGQALPPTDHTSSKPKALTAKSRQKLVLEETRQMSAVLAHPSFKSDPFSAIHEHLKLRVPALQDSSKAKLPLAKEKKLKESSGAQAKKTKPKKMAMRK